jgi:hypothetical protein
LGIPEVINTRGSTFLMLGTIRYIFIQPLLKAASSTTRRGVEKGDKDTFMSVYILLRVDRVKRNTIERRPKTNTINEDQDQDQDQDPKQRPRRRPIPSRPKTNNKDQHQDEVQE